MKFKCIVEYEYPVEHKQPVKADIVLHGDRVTTDKIVPYKGRPNGEWGIYGSDCSNCGRRSDYRTPFCAWCGADMRGDEE